MLTYCLKYKKDAKNINSKVIKAKNDKTMLLSKCAICISKRNIKQFRS